MEVMEAILKRRSVRKYSDIPVPKDLIVDLLIAGQYAPNSGNAHTSRVIVVEDEDVKDAIAASCYHQTWMSNAPIHMVVITNKHRLKSLYGERGEKVYFDQNGAAIAENILLAATANKLASCWVSAFDAEKLSQAVSLGGGYEPNMVITIGYPGETVPTPIKQDISTFTFINAYGGTPARLNNLDFIFKDYSTVVDRHLKKGIKHTKSAAKTIGSKIKKILKK